MFFCFSVLKELAFWKSMITWVRSLCAGPHLCWGWVECAYGFGELWNNVQGVCDSRACGPEPVAGFGTVRLVRSRPGCSFGILAPASSWDGWVHFGAFVGWGRVMPGPTAGKKMPKTLPQLFAWLAAFCLSGLSLNATPQERSSWPPCLAVTLPYVYLIFLFDLFPRTCHWLEYMLHECRGLIDFVHCCILFST